MMKNNNVKVICDGIANMPRELAEQYDIEVVPLTVIVDGKEYKDVDIITLSDNKDNIKILNEMQKEEVTKLFEKISKNFQTKLNEKISELGLKNSSLTSDIENELEDDLDIETDIEDEDNLDTGDEEDDSEEYVDDEEDLSVDSEMNEGFTF